MFKREPIREIDGIKVYSEIDEYVDNYIKIASDHVEHYKKYNTNPFMDEASWKASESVTLELINNCCHLNAGTKILDIGVGLGRLLSQIEFGEKNGMDISLDYLKIAREKGINCIFSKIEDMPYEDEYFDLIICTDVLEHVINLYECSEKILKALKKGGYFAVRVPYKESLKHYVDDSQYEYVHLRNFDEYSLILHFQKLFKLKFVDSKFTYFPSPNFGKNIFSKSYRLSRLIYNIHKTINISKFVIKYYNPYEITIIFKK